jgi:hypothetical protein
MSYSIVINSDSQNPYSFTQGQSFTVPFRVYDEKSLDWQYINGTSVSVLLLKADNTALTKSVTFLDQVTGVLTITPQESMTIKTGITPMVATIVDGSTRIAQNPRAFIASAPILK